MKKVSKILLGTFFLMLLFSTITSFNVVAITDPDEVIDVPGDTNQAQVQANVATMFRFRQRTQLRIQANVNLNLNLECDALRIGDKDFVLEIEGNGDLQMNMTCTQEQEQLGLMLGNTYRIRNQNQYQYQEGFVIDIECNGTFTQARIRIRATNENRLGQFAYHDEATGNWVNVPTTVDDGYLTADVSHFSTWTILLPDYTPLIVGFSIGGGVAALIVIALVFYIKKRK
ncbi:MAG: hypothetical protein EAX91_14230 [Candidatus Lokiarchaeota archaeon]|nr:hypothetical protein [Candidatus Lokiarchaeota archaeon]